MKSSPNNPSTNTLGPGIKETDLIDEISKSGYPLQTIIAEKLRSNFHWVQEEWDYVDRDSQQHRAIDVLAEKWLFDTKNLNDKTRIRPVLALIIECKRSDLPYIFFISPKPHASPPPLVVGLPKNEIKLTTDDDRSSYTTDLMNLLDLNRHPFVTNEPEFCMSFTKCVRGNRGLEFSGNEPFNSLVLPIVKAVNQFHETKIPPKTAFYFDCHLTIGIGVLDAPMVGVNVKENSTDLVLLPWVRIVRHETTEGNHFLEREKLFAIDIVHKDFFKEYQEKHLFPFAEEFSKLTIKHHEAIASGKGFASGMGKYGFRGIEKRLRTKK